MVWSGSGPRTIFRPLRSCCAMASKLPEHVRRAIYGEVPVEEKKQMLEKSLAGWWKEYASRKNDEEEEHVADTLLYDERCHLPRTAPRPDVVPPLTQTNDETTKTTT